MLSKEYYEAVKRTTKCSRPHNAFVISKTLLQESNMQTLWAVDSYLG